MTTTPALPFSLLVSDAAEKFGKTKPFNFASLCATLEEPKKQPLPRNFLPTLNATLS